MANRFLGFSTKNKNAINHQLTGKDLVIEDLMNQIMTRKGERIMLPNYGSIIHDLVFEPMNEDTKTLVQEDLTSIISSEVRAELINIEVSDSDHYISARILINILPENEVAELKIDLERE
jgi:phage baseplate assembly protein W